MTRRKKDRPPNIILGLGSLQTCSDASAVEVLNKMDEAPKIVLLTPEIIAQCCLVEAKRTRKQIVELSLPPEIREAVDSILSKRQVYHSGSIPFGKWMNDRGYLGGMRLSNTAQRLLNNSNYDDLAKFLHEKGVSLQYLGIEPGLRYNLVKRGTN